MGEDLVMHWSKTYKLPCVSLRLFNVYGPRSRTTGAYGAVFGVFLAQKANKKPFTVVGDGAQTRDFTYVTDVVSAFILAADSSRSEHRPLSTIPFNSPGFQETSWIEMTGVEAASQVTPPRIRSSMHRPAS